VPYALTVDYDTLTDKCVTLRERDTMTQVRQKSSVLHCSVVISIACLIERLMFTMLRSLGDRGSSLKGGGTIW
jgi:hypothetical protein